MSDDLQPPRLPQPPTPDAPRGDTSPRRSVPTGRGLTHGLVEALQAQLRDGTLGPGARLPTEAEIVRQYGVSRGVVREALSRLQAAGWVRTQHGVGTFVVEVPITERFDGGVRPAVDSVAEMLELLELRAALESDAAALAAQRRTDAQLAEMRAALDEFMRHLDLRGETVAPDFRFHLAVANATGNRQFLDLMRHLGLDVIPRTRWSGAWQDDATRSAGLRRVHQEHLDVYAAIERQDSEAARAAMRVHLVKSRDRQRAAHQLRD